MNKYLEKIASWKTEELEKEALWGWAGKQLMAAGKAMGGREAKKGTFARGLREFGANVAKGKGYARAALGAGTAATAAGTYAIAKD